MLATDQLSQMGKFWTLRGCLFRWLQVSFCKTPQGSFEIENYPRRIQSKSQAIICKSNNTFSLAHFYMAVHNLRIWSMLHIHTLRYDHLPSSFTYIFQWFPMIECTVISKHCKIQNMEGRKCIAPPRSTNKWKHRLTHNREMAHGILCILNGIKVIFKFSNGHERGEFGPIPTWMRWKFKNRLDDVK